ncbi:MAG TPA: hypothetical protein DCR10_08300 [Acidimicrobiaceae bacterium]|nr:hypothetical protein [Acidimicrobiaceae bacterium]
MDGESSATIGDGSRCSRGSERRLIDWSTSKVDCSAKHEIGRVSGGFPRTMGDHTGGYPAGCHTAGTSWMFTGAAGWSCGIFGDLANSPSEVRP